MVQGYEANSLRIQSVTLRGFRCFGSTGTTIRLSERITILVGTNASGKTAFLEALSRVFGVTRDQRTIRRTDFHVPPGVSADDRSSRELSIDVYLVFPELAQENAPIHAVPPCFHHMVVEKPGGTPFCRVRLEARWTDDGTTDGDIEQSLWWVVTDDEKLTAARLKLVEATRLVMARTLKLMGMSAPEKM